MERPIALKAAKLTTFVSIFTNGLLAIAKIVTGYFAHSAALVADGVHSFADMVSDAFIYVIINVAHAEPDEEHPYGHGKFETIGTLFMALFLALTAIYIGKDAVYNLIYSHKPQLITHIAATVAALSILSNEGLYWYTKYWGEKAKSQILIANAWHHRSDSLSSVAVLIGILFTALGYQQADSIAALTVTCMLLKMAYKIGKRAFDELVEAAVEPEITEQMQNVIKECSGTLGCHRLRARRIGSKIFVDAHVDVESHLSVSEGHAISETVEHALKSAVEDVSDVTVHIDPKHINSAPLTADLDRTHLHNIIQNMLKENSLENFYIHILKSGNELEIILSKKAPKGTKEKLSKELPQFKKVTILEKTA